MQEIINFNDLYRTTQNIKKYVEQFKNDKKMIEMSINVLDENIIRSLIYYKEPTAQENDEGRFIDILIHDMLYITKSLREYYPKSKLTRMLGSMWNFSRNCYEEMTKQKEIYVSKHWRDESFSMSNLPDFYHEMKENYISENTDERIYDNDILDNKDNIKSLIKDIEEENNVLSEKDYIRTGIDRLDEAIGKIKPGDICVITGGPGSMKTSLALQILETYLNRTERGIAYYCSVDMKPREIMMRILERESQMDEEEIIRSSKYNKELYKEFIEKVIKKYSSRVYINGNDIRKNMNLEEFIKNVHKRMPKIVIIDYLTRLKDMNESDLKFVERAMPKIQRSAQEYGIVYIILNQMSRQSRQNQIEGYMGGHSRGGGIVEELASVELELMKEEDSGRIICGIMKARHGRSGEYYDLMYEGRIKRFTGKSEILEQRNDNKKVMYTRKIWGNL